VLCNLLENAAKYTPPGTLVEIGARAAEGKLEVWVADNGPGLQPGSEERIFGKFVRGDQESATPGVGLGLSICRAIVEAHNGSIRAQTRPEGGARFVFTVPLEAAPELEPEPDLHPEREAQ
jgi:two-component system sensor histidine kinase KdpD